MTTAFLGPIGTFSEEAAILHVARSTGSDDVTVSQEALQATNLSLMAFNSIPALTAAVETGLASEAILPIENSLEGSVSSTLDLLIHETSLQIAAEVALPVRHFLITVPGATLADIRVVTSHPQALGQSRRFLERCLPDAEQVAALSTASAVQTVVAQGDRSVAAIGTARAAALYGGEILAHDIQDVRANITRFIALRRQDAAPTGDDKTSLGFTVKDNVPGALYHALGAFAELDLQLTKVESRPTKGWLGEYVFLVDLEGHREDPPVRQALARLRERAAVVKVFGSYPRFAVESLRDIVDPPKLQMPAS
jgi:prephenate dehydratase